MRSFSASISGPTMQSKGNKNTNNAEGTKGIARKAAPKQTPVQRPETSAEEIRDKVSAHKKNLSAPTVKEQQQQLPRYPLDPEAEIEAPSSEISKNDPSDPNTQQKLRKLLTDGGFNFSMREKEILSKILND